MNNNTRNVLLILSLALMATGYACRTLQTCRRAKESLHRMYDHLITEMAYIRTGHE